MEERDMIQPIVGTFMLEGYRLYSEVPLLTKLIDIYGINSVTGHRIAIECKIKDWKQGLFQARNYLMCAEHVFLAVHESFAHRALAHNDCFHDLGIGLLSVNGKAETLIAPKDSVFVNNRIVEKVLLAIRNKPEKEVIISG